MVAGAAMQRTETDATIAAGQAVPKGYKRTELGVIPEDWEVAKLGDIGNFTKGQGIRKDQASSGTIPCVRYGELYTHHHDIIRSYNSYISSEVAQTSKRLKRGDILFACSGETKEEIGKCAAFIDDTEAYAGGDIIILSPSNADSYFLGYSLNSTSVARQKASKGQGDAVVHINAGALTAIKITFPSFLEQQAIAEALNDVDGWVASLDALIAKKRDLKTATMQQLLTGHTRLPGFSGEWEMKKLVEMGYFVSGNGFPIIYQGEKSGDHPFFKVSDMNNDGNATFMSAANHYVSHDIAKKLCANIIPINSIVFAKIGAAIFLERKKILAQDSCLDNNMMAFVVNKSTGDHRYFHYLLLSIELGKLVSATALPSLSGKEIGSLAFPVPQLEEQTAIATILSDMDAEIATLEAEREKASAIKQGMMQELLTGKTRLI